MFGRGLHKVRALDTWVHRSAEGVVDSLQRVSNASRGGLDVFTHSPKRPEATAVLATEVTTRSGSGCDIWLSIHHFCALSLCSTHRRAVAGASGFESKDGQVIELMKAGEPRLLKPRISIIVDFRSPLIAYSC